MFYFLLSFLVIFVFVEGTFLPLPLTMILLICLLLVKRSSIVFPLAFVAGLLLDAMNLRPLGATSLFLLTYLFLILWYQRKYEIYTYQFMMVATLIGSLVFLQLFGYEYVIARSIISSILGGLLFWAINVEFTFPSTKTQAKT